MTIQWRLKLSELDKKNGYKVCPLCQRARVHIHDESAFCEGCLARAAAAPRPSPQAERVKIPPSDHPRVRRKGYTARERAALARVFDNLGIDAG